MDINDIYQVENDINWMDHLSHFRNYQIGILKPNRKLMNIGQSWKCNHGTKWMSGDVMQIDI